VLTVLFSFLSHRQVQAPAVGAHELLLPELLEHVRQHEQEGYWQGELRQWRLSDLAYQAVLGRRCFSEVPDGFFTRWMGLRLEQAVRLG
jgi:hypothetical protein